MHNVCEAPESNFLLIGRYRYSIYIIIIIIIKCACQVEDYITNVTFVSILCYFVGETGASCKKHISALRMRFLTD